MFADCQLMGMDLAFPDICKTPPALLPIPYPNVAVGSMAIPTVWNTFLMGMPAHNLLTTIALSNGDNPGVAMGLISQTVMAQARRITCVPNVLFGCIPATRMTCLTVQNTINTVGMRLVPSQFKVVLLGGGGGGTAGRASGKGSGIVQHGARGRASETRVLKDMGLTKNRTPVSTQEGVSIPDGLTRSLLVEIKDTIQVNLSRQLRIQTQAARAAGRKSALVTGNHTRVSGPASRAFDMVVRRADLGPK